MTDKEPIDKMIELSEDLGLYKEQIIINGVDVSVCENYRPKDRFTCHPYICNCHQKPDCYFKQLARKTQECEELLKENQQLRNSLSDSLMFKFTAQENEINRYRKALEEVENNARINR